MRAVVMLAVLLVGGTSAVQGQLRSHPARYLYVWAGSGNDSTQGVDVVTVLDANPANLTYGKIVAALTVDSAGKMPHHVELVLPGKGPYFANDYSADKSFLVDFSNPPKPRLAGRVDAVPGGRTMHSFARLANGHVIATVQFGDTTDAGKPGMLAEFDANGKLIRSGSARDGAFPGAHIRTYSLMPLPLIDRVVTTSNPMDNEEVAQVVQVWRLSDLKLLKTLQMPASPPGDSTSRYPFELTALPGGRSVLVNTYTCGFFTVTDIDSNPRLEHVLSLQQPRDFGCSVPVVKGKFMLMPIAYGHRYATIDISDPSHPKEVSSLTTDKTFYPHWASADPGSDRIVFTDQGDGPPKVMIGHFNPATGRLTWDERFRDAGSAAPGVSYQRDRWPNGLKGMLMPHGALFVP